MQDQTPYLSRGTIRSLFRRISVFDGQDLKRALLASAAWLEENREYINALNVFPVPDGDTGSNMSRTMQAAVKGIADSDDTSAGVIASRAAHSALLGARGNSGVILSQILRGLALGLEQKHTFTAQDLARSMQEAQRLAYGAVLKPVEGTILTVIRETAEAATASVEQGEDVLRLMHTMLHAARKAVERTPELLPTLKQAGVVDSGGQGLYTILEGIWRYIHGETSPRQFAFTEEQPRREAHKGVVTIEEEFGYEVVFLLRGTNLSVEGIRQGIIDLGGVSTVVAGDEKLLKVHTHTEWPGKILDYGVSLGSLLDINVENLQEQSLTYAAASALEHSGEQAATTEPTRLDIATVAVASGEGFVEVFKSLGVTAIVPGGQTMNPSTEELLSAVNAAPADRVILLPNNKNVLLSARQVLHLTEKEVTLIPTETMPQGIAALMGFDFSADFDSNCQAMTRAAQHIQTAEITTAVRSVQIDGLNVQEGDCIGIINGRLTTAGQDLRAIIDETLKHMHIEQFEIVTLYFGEQITRQEAEETAQHVLGNHSHLEIQVVNGNQAHYSYIISAE
jgi:DAK2 domain fusion protein YloV